MSHLSPSEIKFIRDGIAVGVRPDGRGLLETRHSSCSAGPLPATHGSCRVKGAFHGTDVLCGVKLEVGIMPLVVADMDVSVDVSALARGDLVGLGEANKRVEGRGRELADALMLALRGKLPELDIVKGKSRWIVYVDVVCFGDGGNLFDAIVLATYGALRSALVPKTFMVQVGDVMDFDVDPDPRHAVLLDTSSLCLSVTVWIVNGQLLLDPTLEEELCADAWVSNCVRARDGAVQQCVKRGPGGLAPELVLNAMALASSLAKDMCSGVCAQ